MSDTNDTPVTESAPETQPTEATPAKLYATRDEALAAKPSDAPKSLKVFEVSKAGAMVGFMLGRGYDPCLAALARKDGYTVSLGNSAPVTKEAVAAKLTEFSDDELAALGLSRKKGQEVDNREVSPNATPPAAYGFWGRSPFMPIPVPTSLSAASGRARAGRNPCRAGAFLGAFWHGIQRQAKTGGPGLGTVRAVERLDEISNLGPAALVRPGPPASTKRFFGPFL